MNTGTNGHEDRFLATLQRLLEIPTADLQTALTHASNALADALGADKVDAFLYDESRDSLVALGVSVQPLSDLQRRLGLDVLPMSNGGRVVGVYRTGETYRNGAVQGDEEELRGIKEGMHVRSELGVPLVVAGRRRGMLMIASLKPDFFTEADAAFVASAAHWVGIVAAHSELTQSIRDTAVEDGRRARAEELVTVLAHDLRNGLSPIMLRLYTLRSRAQAQSREEDREDLQFTLDGLNRLNALITDLLDTARLDAGAFQVRTQPVDIGDIVQEAARAQSSGEHPILVSATGTMIVAADPVRLRQCVDNILSNAIAHSPVHAPVTVMIATQQHGGRSWARLDIVDEGPGISEAMLPHLFDPFISGRLQSGGVGLGLYIAQRIASAHGGELVADRYPGKGARFTLRLPVLDTTNT